MGRPRRTARAAAGQLADSAARRQILQYTGRMYRHLITACFLVSLTACQTGLTPQPGDTADPVLAITTVTLNTDFAVRADFAGEYIQSGFITPFNSISLYHTFCKLELRRPAPQERTIAAGAFTISRIYREMEFVGFARQMFAGDGSSGMVMSRTVMFLQSEEQPDIFRLSCMKQDFSFYASQPTLEEMQTALGDILTLQSNAPTRQAQ